MPRPQNKNKELKMTSGIMKKFHCSGISVTDKERGREGGRKEGRKTKRERGRERESAREQEKNKDRPVAAKQR